MAEDKKNTDLAIQGQYEKYLKLYNQKQQELSEQEEMIGEAFEAYQSNINELKDLKGTLKNIKREFREMSLNERKVHQLYKGKIEK